MICCLIVVALIIACTGCLNVTILNWKMSFQCSTHFLCMTRVNLVVVDPNVELNVSMPIQRFVDSLCSCAPMY